LTPGKGGNIPHCLFQANREHGVKRKKYLPIKAAASPAGLFGFLLIIGLVFGFVSNSNAGQVEIRIGNTVITKEVNSFKDKKFDYIVRQTEDFSCGAAALATVMTHYFGQDTSEQEVLNAIFLNSDEETKSRINQQGISLLELKNYAEAKGLVGRGYRMKPEQLKTLDRPAIIMINYRDYTHFVVIKGVAEGKVYLADPARGIWFCDLDDFGQMWGGILLAFKRDNGEKVTQHDLEMKPFFSRQPLDMLPASFIDTWFATQVGEF
jgi:predicted double-glycine peptidase